MKDSAIQESVKEGKKFGYMDKVKNITKLPARKIVVAYIKEAMELNASGTAKPKPKKAQLAVAIEPPKAFIDALKKDKKAEAIFEAKPPSFLKNYIIWIANAKTDETLQKRIQQSLEWIAEGKDRFWQFKK